MKRRRHTPEQIVRKLREVERLLGEGQTIAQAAKQVEISEETYHRWRKQYGAMKADDAKRLRELERENARLKRIVATRNSRSTRSRRSPGNTGKPVAPARGSLHVAGPPRVVGTASMPGHRPAPLHTAPPPGARPRRRRAARGTPRLLAWPPPLGVPPGLATLREEGWGVNRKRVQRLWREEGLRVPVNAASVSAWGTRPVPAARLRAERPNHVWALDFQFDQTADGRALKLLKHRREHTREALAIVTDRRITADAAASTLDGIVARRGTAPGYIRCDNGPELTANALRDLVPVLRYGQQLHRARCAAGRTRTWSRSTAGCATSSWPSSSSTACSRRRC